MNHASEETLATLRDGRSIARRSYRHVDRCVACRRALGEPLPPEPDRSEQTFRQRAVAAVTIAAFLAVVLLAEPLRATAFGFVEIFEPHQIALIPMSQSDFAAIRSLPDFEAFGTTQHLIVSQSRYVATPRGAEAVAGFHVRVPSVARNANALNFQIATPSLEQLTFSEAIAKREASVLGKPFVPMPVGMDGGMVRIALGSVVTMRVWEPGGSGYRSTGSPLGDRRNRLMRPLFESRTTLVARGPGSATNHVGNLFVMQMPVPKIGSTGVSISEMERYFVEQPGVPSRLAAAFAALRDPTTTLPLPVPIDHRYAQSVYVDGVTGTQIGDDTGLGAVAVWERNGFIYAVGGQGRAADILAIANTLQ